MKRILLNIVMYLPVYLLLITAVTLIVIATVGIIQDANRQSNEEEYHES